MQSSTYVPPFFCLRFFRSVASLGLVVFAFAGAGCNRGPAKPADVAPDTWATVDGRSITREDVEKAFRRTQDQATAMSAEEAMTVKLGILDELIVQDILLAKAKALKIEAPAAELDNAFNQRKQNLTDEQFQQELKKRDLTPESMREALRREVVAQKLLEQEVTSKVNVTDQEVTDFFNANRAQFNVAEESYRLAQIVVTPAPGTQQVNRTGNDAGTPQEAAFKVRMIMERLKTGTNFRELAMDYSEDPETAPRGGDLGLVPLSALQKAPAPFRDAVIGQNPGTAKVASFDGAHRIVAVLGHEQAGQRDLSTPGLKDNIMQTLKNRKEQLRRSAYLAAARYDADVVNHLARRLVASGGKL
jgi:peptidyl-prolyl cis-trans isomerase SurA